MKKSQPVVSARLQVQQRSNGSAEMIEILSKQHLCGVGESPTARTHAQPAPPRLPQLK